MLTSRFCTNLFVLFQCFKSSKSYNSQSHRTMAQEIEFPTTLKGFGYGFNEEGQLRQIDPSTGQCTDRPFEFEISAEHAHNQQHYEALDAVINEHVYELLEKNGLHKIYLPSDVPESDATFVFATKRNLKDVKKLLILINGSGVVRAGQWARRLIINQSLNHGKQIPYINLARKNGYDVLVLNTNDNERNDDYIPGHSSPSEHANSVWSEMIADANVEGIAIVAHSYGGVVAMDLVNRLESVSGVQKRRIFEVFTGSLPDFWNY